MKLLINLSISLVALIIFLFGAEIVVHTLSSRMVQSHFGSVGIVGMFKTCQIKNQGSSLSPSFYQLTNNPPGLWYELKPGAEGLLYNHEVKINSFGMREDETTLEKPANTFRIAVLSDSATFGYGVDKEDRYSDILEGKLKEVVKSKNIEMLNFAVPGYNSKQELILLKDKVLKFNPDLILIGHSLNDIYGEGTVSLATSALRRFMMSRSALFNCFDANKIAGIKRIFVTDADKNLPYTEMYKEGSDTWNQYIQVLPEFAQAVKEKKVPVLVVLLPIFHDLNENYEFSDIDKRLSAEIEKAGLYVLNTSPDQGIVYDEGSSYLVSPDDFDHPTRKGHNVVAELILERLEKLKLLPK